MSTLFDDENCYNKVIIGLLFLNLVLLPCRKLSCQQRQRTGTALPNKNIKKYKKIHILSMKYLNIFIFKFHVSLQRNGTASTNRNFKINKNILWGPVLSIISFS